MSSGWINVIPDVLPSFGETGKTLGYYYNIAHYLIIVPIVLLALIAIVYNVLVGIATVWMYKHAWKKGGFFRSVNVNLDVNTVYNDIDERRLGNVPIAPGLPTTIWEEIFTVNIKVANYLFGGVVDIQDNDGYLVLRLHDYIVVMPLMIIFIQVCELAIAAILIVLYVDYLVLQVSHSCDPAHLSVDCYDSSDSNMSSLPLDCSDAIASGNITKFTCFHLSLNPVIAAAVTGGFLKITPHVMFTTMTYSYLKMLKFTHYFECNAMINLISHIVVAVIAEFLYLSAGIVVLVLLLKVDSLNVITFSQADPMKQLTIILCFLFYFLASSFIWCIYPQTKTPIRFQSSVWKQKIAAARGTREKSPGKPWIVVDRSLNTKDQKLLMEDDD